MVCIRAGAGFVSVPFSEGSPGLSRSEAALLLPPAYLIRTETGLEPSDRLAHKTVSGDAGVAVEEETDGVAGQEEPDRRQSTWMESLLILVSTVDCVLPVRSLA